MPTHHCFLLSEHAQKACFKSSLHVWLLSSICSHLRPVPAVCFAEYEVGKCSVAVSFIACWFVSFQDSRTTCAWLCLCLACGFFKNSFVPFVIGDGSSEWLYRKRGNRLPGWFTRSGYEHSGLPLCVVCVKSSVVCHSHSVKFQWPYG